MAEDSTTEIDAIGKVSLLQAVVRGYLTRKKLREAQEMYREIVESIEGSDKARELQWVVHGRLPIPVHKHKEPELTDFLKRLTDRVPVERTCEDQEGYSSTSNRDTDTGTYTVSTSDKYSSLTTDESSSLSGKTTSSVVTEFADGDDDTVGTQNKTSRHIPDVKRSATEESSVSPETIVDKHEDRVLREVKPAEGKDRLKSNGRKIVSKEKCETLADSTDTLAMESGLGNEGQEEKYMQQEDLDVNELSGDRYQNSRNGKILQFQTEEDGSAETCVDKKRLESDVHLTKRSEHPKHNGGGNGSNAVNHEMKPRTGETIVDDNVDGRKGGERVKERLLKGSSSDDDKVPNMNIQTQSVDLDNVRAERDVSRIGPDVVRTGPDVDFNERGQVEDVRGTQSRQCDKVTHGSSESQEGDTVPKAFPSSDDANQSLKGNDTMSSKRSDGGDGVLCDTMSIVNITDDDEKLTHKEKGQEMEEEKEGDEDTKERNINGNEDDSIPFAPPSPIMSQSLARNQKQFVTSSSPVLHHDLGEISVLSKTERLKDEGSDEDGDSTMFTKVTSLGVSLMSEQTSVWDTDSEDVSVVGRSSFPQDLSQLQTLRKNIAMELLWVQQAIESRKAYLRLKTNLDNKSKTTKVQKGT